ncbi:formimidoylglutamate deiminase [Psychromonas sp. RZ22]|uniref:formimidoylglutamate deiminase n=1 Tax=Psychromonas algarum TaxID=2555643 RepID=UPI00106768C6|nr:formimidoylglutamate deiminase [Psychromonas sp. RZ22]TEW56824.1 formimidoylglutamate deiminase [Psychromonas sp. RZ22]
MGQLAVQQLLLSSGWAKDKLIQWDDTGIITSIGLIPEGYTGEKAHTIVAGMPNIHSHAFQRLCAGLTEYRSTEQDSFWSWRKLMYALADKITPEQLEAIATHLYSEMLAAGYTSVCEFNYLHNDVNGQPYKNSNAFFDSLINAANKSGIGLTLLPVYYNRAGFDKADCEKSQQRFALSLDAYLKRWNKLFQQSQRAGFALGIAPHSLRAVSGADLKTLVERIKHLSPEAPVHIHISEQIKEVEDCLAFTGKRPFNFLQSICDVDDKWCLVHGTHFDKEELKAIAQCEATVALCPITEANLGDGIFDYVTYGQHIGTWGIGSDSNILIDAREELMLLEYGQRLLHRQRNIASSPNEPHVATNLYQQALVGGEKASGLKVGKIEVGYRADFIELANQQFTHANKSGDFILSQYIFADSHKDSIRRVWSAGKLLIDTTSQPRYPLPEALCALRNKYLEYEND